MSSRLFRKILLNTCFKKEKLNKISVKSHFSSNEKEQKRFKIQSYLLTRYLNLVKSCEEILNKNFPNAAKVYKLFTLGIKEFKDDAFLLFKAHKKVHTCGYSDLTRKELEVYHKMPKDMIRVAPTIVIGTGIPLGAAIFGLAYMFPRAMLSYHFWSPQQRADFALQDHKKRLKSYKPILHHMLSQFECGFREEKDAKFKETLQDLLCGAVLVDVKQLLKHKHLFQGPPFSIGCMHASHVHHLLKLHNLHLGWNRRLRLQDRALLIHAMDMALIREGGVEMLSQDDLQSATFFRGLNPVDMKEEEIVIWLNNWMTLSKELDPTCYSLLLHSPVLLAHSHPSNMKFSK